MNSFTDKICQRPIACCWHPGRNLLLVTTFDAVFTVNVGSGPFSKHQPKFKILCKTPFGNNYGIDVSTDGLIVVIGYNSNRVCLNESNGTLVGVYEIANALVQQQLLPRNDALHYSGVSFSHDGRYILCFSNKGIQVIDRSGNFICTFGSFGAKPGFFRGEGQIVRLSGKNRFAISDVGNNRIQIVEIDWEQLTLKLLSIIGNNCFIDPIGIVPMENCIVIFSHSQQMFYVYKTSGEVIEVPTQLMPGTRFACSLPDGSIVIVNQSHSLVTLIQENPNIPITLLSGLGLKELKF
jgi:DNA-binding beta-propeller fold protein YncE